MRFQIEVTEELIKNQDGNLRSHDYGVGNLIYLVRDSTVICCRCALDAFHQGERVIMAPYYEGPTQYCEGCDQAIQATYGDPEDHENE